MPEHGEQLVLAPVALLHRLLLSLAHVADDRHPADDRPRRVAHRKVAARERTLAAALGHAVGPLPGLDRLTGQHAPEDLVLAALDQEREHLEGDAAEDALRPNAGDALHAPAPVRVAAREVEAEDAVEAALEEATEPALRFPRRPCARVAAGRCAFQGAATPARRTSPSAPAANRMPT